MNLLYISNEYPPDTGYGGIGTYTKHCAEGMAARGHTVHVICRSPAGELKTTTDSGVFVHRVPPGVYPLPSQRFFYPFRAFCYHTVPDSLVRLAWAKQAYTTFINDSSLKNNIDIVEYPECGGEGYYFASEPGIVKIARLHTPWTMVRKFDRLRQKPLDGFVLSHIERSAAQHSTHVTSPSRALASIVQRQWRVSQPFVIPNPIPSSLYPLSGGTDLLFLGRVEQRKGVHLLIEAYARICRQVTPPLLRLVGAPYGTQSNGVAYGDHISRLILNVPRNGVVEWIRGIPHASVIDFLRRSSIAVFPSLWENLSYACLEAMASGCAVVAADCGGFPEMIVHGETGLLFEPNDVESLTDALLYLVSQPGTVKKLGARARDHVAATYDTARVCSLTEKMYSTFLTRRNQAKTAQPDSSVRAA
jgi:glycogen synthase